MDDDFLPLHRMQFEGFQEGGKNYRQVQAYLPAESGYEKEKIGLGHIQWAPPGSRMPGEITSLRVNPLVSYGGQMHEARRQGIATAMWQHAHELAATDPETFGPGPRHSSKRTPAGTSWAKSTGAKVPKLTKPLPDEDD